MMLTLVAALYVGYYVLAVDRGLSGARWPCRPRLRGPPAWSCSWLPLPYLEVGGRGGVVDAGGAGGVSATSRAISRHHAREPISTSRLFRPVTPSGAHERLLFRLLLPALVLLGARGPRPGVAPAEVRRARRIFGLVAWSPRACRWDVPRVWGVNTRSRCPTCCLLRRARVVAMRVPARFAFVVLLAVVPLSPSAPRSWPSAWSPSAPGRWRPARPAVQAGPLFTRQLVAWTTRARRPSAAAYCRPRGPGSSASETFSAS